MKVLVIEDNPLLAKSIQRALKQEHFSVSIFWSGDEAEKYWSMHHQEIDVVILDIQLPGKNGFEVCKTIRGYNIHTPVIMLTAKWSLEDRVNGLEVGADDYLVKPFKFEELLARIHALLRRPRKYHKERLQIQKDLFFDGVMRKVLKQWEEIHLTPKEFSILEFLVRYQNEAVSQQDIFDHCFDFAKDNWSNAVEVHIKNLRKKLYTHDEEPNLKTIRGFGYCLEIQ